jgi:hypothetical protein
MIVQFTTAADVWEWIAHANSDALPEHRRVYRYLHAQAGISEAYTLREVPGEVPRVIVGIVDLAPDEGELWFMGPPAGRGGLGSWVVRLVRFARDFLDASQARRPRTILCHVRAGHRDGQRLCLMLGFEFAGVADGIETWRRRWVS